MKRRFQIAVRCCAAVLVAGLAQTTALAVAGPPAWTVHYTYSAMLGNTNADFDSGGRFRIVASSKAAPGLPAHPVEAGGLLPHDEREALNAVVASARPDLWSSSYPSPASLRCINSAELAFETRNPHGGANTTKTMLWGCRLAGLPAGLRRLLEAVRGNVRTRVPSALLDTAPAADGVAPPWPLTLGDDVGAIRRVTIASGGRIVSRERTSTTLFALKACPQRDLGSVGPIVLARMHAMLVPPGDVVHDTSSDTDATFGAAMSDCPRPVEWLNANDYVIPGDAHWAVQFTMQRGPRSATVEVASLGRADAFVPVFDGGPPHRIDMPVAVDTGTVTELGRLVGAVRENAWTPRLLGTDTDCVNGLRIARFYNGQSTQALTSVSCDNAGAPADVLALISFLTAHFGAYAGARPVSDKRGAAGSRMGPP